MTVRKVLTGTISAAAAVSVLILNGCGPSTDRSHYLRIEIPETVPTITGGTLYVLLLTYDPLLADASASIGDRKRISFDHNIGERTVVETRLAAVIPSGWDYYITVDACQGTAGDRIRLLWGGLFVEKPHVVVMRPTENESCHVAAWFD